MEELLDLEDVMNQDAVAILGKQRDPKTLLLRKVEFSDENESEGTRYRTLSLELAYRKSTWVTQFPSTGFEELVLRDATPNDPQSIRINVDGIDKVAERKTIVLDGDGQRPSEPQILDKDGKWVKHPTPDDIVILTAEINDVVPFAPLLNYIAQ